jgi:hypothetical protein
MANMIFAKPKPEPKPDKKSRPVEECEFGMAVCAVQRFDRSAVDRFCSAFGNVPSGEKTNKETASPSKKILACLLLNTG